MNYGRSMILLSLLYQSTSGENREILSRVFQNTISKSDEFDQIKKTLETSVFFEPTGKHLHDEAQELANVSYYDIAGVSKNLLKIQALVESIEKEVSKTDEIMHSPSFSNKVFSVVSRQQIDTYVKYENDFASCICYYMLMMDGAESLRSLRFNRSADLQELNEIVSQRFASELLQKKDSVLPVWTLEKVDFHKSDVIEYSGFVLTYGNVSMEQVRKDYNAGQYVRIAPNVYASISGSQKKWIGIGNVVGGDPCDALSFLNAEVITSIPLSAKLDLDIPATQLITMISDTIGTSCFCISPENLAHVLNRRGMAEAVITRRSGDRCIICGQQLEFGNNVACNKHFKVNPRDGY